VLLAMFFALLPAVLVYKIARKKPAAVPICLLAAILLTRVLVLTQERVIKETADSARRRYKAGRIPIGKDTK